MWLRHGCNAKTCPAGSAQAHKWSRGWSGAEAATQDQKTGTAERAIELRTFALQLLGRHGRWTTLPPYGDEVLRFEDSRFSILFYVREQVPKDFRERFHLAPLAHGLYNLDLWNLRDEPRGKVLNINWLTVGAIPSIVTFRRGDWEQRLLRG